MPGIPVFMVGIFLTLLCHGSQQLEVTDFDEIMLDDDCKVDITDMTDYDPVTQTSARCEKRRRERQQARAQCDQNLKEQLAWTQHLLNECQNLNGPVTIPPLSEQQPECECDPTPCPDSAKAENMFFRLLTGHLVNLLQAKGAESGPVDAQITVSLSAKKWKKLQNFVNDRENYRKAEIYDILVGMTIETFHVNQTSVLEWVWEQASMTSPGIILLVMSAIVISFVFGVGMYSDILWNRRFLGCLFTAIFVISLISNWIYLYQEETIKRYTKAQTQDGVPLSCKPKEMTWLQALLQWFQTMTSVKTDECLKYHMQYLVDPVFDVPPTRALSFTVSSMFVEPMKQLGRAVSEFHREIYSELPLWAAISTLVSTYIFLFIALYAFISAPRRVIREPRGQHLRRRLGQHPRHGRDPALEAEGRDYLLAPDDEREPHIYADYQERRAVRPPTLPPAGLRMRGTNADRNVWNEAGEGAQGAPRQGAVVQPQTLRGLEEEQLEEDVNVLAEEQGSPLRGEHRQAVGGCRLRTGRLVSNDFPDPAEARSGDRVVAPVERRGEGDSDHPPQGQLRPRPTNLRDAKALNTPASESERSSQQGKARETQSGSPLNHPSSEPSEFGSIPGSAAMSQSESEVQASYFAAPPPEDCTTPCSADSPSDISVISPSPEDITNSASYDVISTSALSLGETTVTTPSEDESKSNEACEDSDDDFVVLKTER
ncbi:uncharacterized protein [Diadema antillarum]|uniref:uncharacterized protein n=1 Tax=Diadema antillarum TaxID=105358 RepID=UPI003A8A5BB2